MSKLQKSQDMDVLFEESLSEFQLSIARVITELRKAGGHGSQETFAAKLGLHRNSQQRVEKFMTGVTIPYLFRVADALGMDVSEIIALAEKRLRDERQKAMKAEEKPGKKVTTKKKVTKKKKA